MFFICSTYNWHFFCMYAEVHIGSPLLSSMQNILERGQEQAKNNQTPKCRPHTLYIYAVICSSKGFGTRHLAYWQLKKKCSKIRHAVILSHLVHILDEITKVYPFLLSTTSYLLSYISLILEPILCLCLVSLIYIFSLTCVLKYVID